MIIRPRPSASKNPELAKAQANFTAEGAPAPGKVASGPPALPPTVAPTARVPVKAPPRRQGPKPAGRHRW